VDNHAQEEERMTVGEDVSLSGGNYALVVVVAVIALVALVMGGLFRQQVLAADDGTAKMQEIGRAVEEGATAFLTRQFKTLAVFALLAFLLLFVLPGETEVRIGRSLFFLVGAGFSARSAGSAWAWPSRRTSGWPQQRVTRAATPRCASRSAPAPSSA
jgi:Na+/H+-translocating membrane pyrophosphatase